jgi:uncharacterized protein YecE (DUF72 family)
MASSIYIGTAGWNIRKEHVSLVKDQGTHLQRYASRFACVEINSSFYRPHRPTTYARWAASTPPQFRFAIKFPKLITHELRLCDAAEPIMQFSEQVAGLGDKLGVVLVQLPPSLAFDAAVAECFFQLLRMHVSAPVACEPRHVSWFTSAAEAMLCKHGVARVAADPSIVPAVSVPGGDVELAYFRWHGSPRMYYSEYDAATLRHLADQIVASSATSNYTWCIFDNTAAGAAFYNAISLSELLENSHIDGQSIRGTN